MEGISVELQEQPDVFAIQEQFQDLKNYTSRLKALLKLRPGSIIGLGSDHFEKSFTKQLPIEKVVQIRKDILNDLAFLTNRSVRTISRGLTSFLKTRFSLTKIRKIDAVWLHFSIESKIDNKEPSGSKNEEADRSQNQVAMRKKQNPTDNKKVQLNEKTINIRRKRRRKNNLMQAYLNISNTASSSSNSNDLTQKQQDFQIPKKTTTNKKKMVVNSHDPRQPTAVNKEQTFKKRRKLKNLQSHSKQFNQKAIQPLQSDKFLIETQLTDLKPYISKNNQIVYSSQNKNVKNLTNSQKNENLWGYGRIVIDFCPKNHNSSQETWLSEIGKQYGIEF
ncbi:hypothetical protein M0812_06016 [Anaeramoeba flamelloides]|uniref:Uncharacterized protein n=1 Tax=Anaeramoeba flamelloides TaxID=1746091 RepID=A0AAV8A8V5_9EUKA|nr:hypothetical protein M0812_06016 [Anaeramoeba flamelloides]